MPLHGPDHGRDELKFELLGRNVMRQISATRTVMTGAMLLTASMAMTGCISTATYGTGEAPELSIIKGVTTGLTSKKKEKIVYTPRAPLVVPPQATLPAPVQQAGDADADWPVEPGSAGTEVADGLGDTSRTDPGYVRRLQPLVGALPADERPASYDPEKASQYAHLDGLRNPDARKKFKAAINNAEGYDINQRRYLTDPPTAYSQPAETAPKEFDDIDENPSGSGFAKFFNWRNRNKR
ncbi:MAG TPA: hypothetical protein VKN63_05245 [Afifellaceae bacterium]|nr:hypothetical protein [Afifellaceae bacterium]